MKSEDIMDVGERVLVVDKEGNNALNYLTMPRGDHTDRAITCMAYHSFYQALKKAVLNGKDL